MLVSWGEDGVLGGALQRLAIEQLGAVQRQRQAVSYAQFVDVPFLASASIVPFFPPGQVGGGISSKPGADGVEVVGVRWWSPHALWVSVWDVCGGGKKKHHYESWQSWNHRQLINTLFFLFCWEI